VGRVSAKVRPPAVAGQFYTRHPERLHDQVQKFMAAAPPYAGSRPKAVIAPHAGYVYSGAVAGIAFAAAQNASPKPSRVVVMGPAHYVPFRGIAAPRSDAFETPLGRVPLDTAALSGLGDLPYVSADDAPHAPEHAIEVELPFLQVLLQDFVLVPLVVGDAKPEEVGEVLARLWGEDDSLIVISSDLSHYHAHATAQRLDAATAAAIEKAQWATLGPQDACGYLPITGLLREATQRNLTAQRLALCNSGDTAGDRARVVGYGAWAFGSSASLVPGPNWRE
jgi:AmmeMemoRadiSam system protein B